MFRFMYFLFIFICELMFVDTHVCELYVCVYVFGTYVCICLWQLENDLGCCTSGVVYLIFLRILKNVLKDLFMLCVWSFCLHVMFVSTEFG